MTGRRDVRSDPSRPGALRPIAAALSPILAGLVVLAAQPASAAERWSGSVDVPGGQVLEFSVTLEESADGEWSGTIDIPAQGAMGLPLGEVKRTGSEIAFSIPQVGAAWSFTLEGDGRKATGQLKQHGLTMPAVLEAMSAEKAAAAEPRRPQAPKPPFPYQQWEVRYENPNDGTKLAGTLTVPEGRGPFPAAVLITGSGAQDRDESIAGHAPFWVIADHLSRHGIAVLRSDDRGVGGSEGNVSQATPEDSVGDVRGAVELLRSLKTIDSDRIGLIGHSEGGIIAPMVAARDRRIDFVVMLAGTGVPGKQVLEEQLAALLRAEGTPEETIEAQVEAQQEMLTLVLAGKADDEVGEAIRALVRAQAGDAISEEAVDELVAAELRKIRTPWFRSFMELDPRVALRKVRAPVLVLNGELDRQVIPSQNLPEIRAALDAAGNDDVTVRELEGLNHLFQHATTGGISEYAQIEETIAPEVLDLLASWIREQTMATPAG